MKQNKSFILKEIANIPYLLPYGQMIADQKRGIQINATGAYLWKLLEQDCSMEELLLLSAEYYEIPETELDEFCSDIRQFIKRLISYGIVLEDSMIPSENSTDAICLTIGGLNICLQGPSAFIPTEFLPFTTTNCDTVHQTIILHPGSPAITRNGTLLIRNRDLIVLEAEVDYLLLFPSSKHIQEIHLQKEGTMAICYCLPPFNEAFHYDIFHALRLVFLYLAQKKKMVALHSASILYQGKAWLFSGHSGMGKSTHTNLWKSLYQIMILNGDLNLLTMKHGKPVIHGIPWCGTSEICSTETVPLGGIILLNQAPSDRIEILSPDQKQLLVSQRLISPSWTHDLFEQNMTIVSHILPHVLVCKLHCTKDNSAAEVMKTYVDEYLSQQRNN